MQSITTKYRGPTDKRGSRIIATAAGGKRLTWNIDNSERVEWNHLAAAKKLAKSLDWLGCWWGGHTKQGMVWVIQSNHDLEKFTTTS